MAKEPQPASQKKSRRLLLIIAVFCLVVAPLVCRQFVYEPFKIPSGAMRPTLHEGDHIFASKSAYTFGDIQRGDIIVFRYPLDESKDFIKRVVGLPGDDVTVFPRGLRLRRAGESEAARVPMAALDEPCPDEQGRDVPLCTTFEEELGNRPHRVMYRLNRDERMEEPRTFSVPDDHLFVLGDNRNQSHDSTTWTRLGPGGEEIPAPFVPMDNVKGRAARIWLPFSRWGPIE